MALSERQPPVSSGAGFAAIPMLSAYVVSKTALYRLSDNLAARTVGQARAMP
jgi:short-subunit dehydrogenase